MQSTRSAPVEGKDDERGKRAAVLALLFVLLVAYTGFPFWVQLLTGYDETITVENIPASRTCSDLNGRFHKKHRSDAPPAMGLGFCGHVEADTGAYKLPNSGVFSFAAAREEIFDAFTPGCSYKVHIAGFGPRPKKGFPTRVPLQKTIMRVKDPLGC